MSQGPAAYSSTNGGCKEAVQGDNDSEESLKPARRISSESESSLSFTFAWALLSAVWLYGVQEHAVRTFKSEHAEGENNERRR